MGTRTKKKKLHGLADDEDPSSSIPGAFIDSDDEADLPPPKRRKVDSPGSLVGAKSKLPRQSPEEELRPAKRPKTGSSGSTVGGNTSSPRQSRTPITKNSKAVTNNYLNRLPQSRGNASLDRAALMDETIRRGWGPAEDRKRVAAGLELSPRPIMKLHPTKRQLKLGSGTYTAEELDRRCKQFRCKASYTSLLSGTVTKNITQYPWRQSLELEGGPFIGSCPVFISDYCISRAAANADCERQALTWLNSNAPKHALTAKELQQWIDLHEKVKNCTVTAPEQYCLEEYIRYLSSFSHGIFTFSADIPDREFLDPTDSIPTASLDGAILMLPVSSQNMPALPMANTLMALLFGFGIFRVLVNSMLDEAARAQEAPALPPAVEISSDDRLILFNEPLHMITDRLKYLSPEKLDAIMNENYQLSEDQKIKLRSLGTRELVYHFFSKSFPEIRASLDFISEEFSESFKFMDERIGCLLQNRFSALISSNQAQWSSPRIDLKNLPLLDREKLTLEYFFTDDPKKLGELLGKDALDRGLMKSLTSDGRLRQQFWNKVYAAAIEQHKKILEISRISYNAQPTDTSSAVGLYHGAYMPMPFYGYGPSMDMNGVFSGNGGFSSSGAGMGYSEHRSTPSTGFSPGMGMGMGWTTHNKASALTLTVPNRLLKYLKAGSLAAITVGKSPLSGTAISLMIVAAYTPNLLQYRAIRVRYKPRHISSLLRPSVTYHLEQIVRSPDRTPAPTLPISHPPQCHHNNHLHLLMVLKMGQIVECHQHQEQWELLEGLEAELPQQTRSHHVSLRWQIIVH